ncbi:MAG: type II toxin-antitoxin system HicB family antitoxin [Phycisphaeraceae bacterium]|nr:type II toxin-antitoxin system HicB family antitoxin [Phycisphaeraceae bacterium]
MWNRDKSRHRLSRTRWRERFIERCAVIDRPASDGGYGASVPILPSCVAASAAIEEARAFILEDVELHLAGVRDDGAQIPPPATQAEHVQAG